MYNNYSKKGLDIGVMSLVQIQSIGVIKRKKALGTGGLSFQLTLSNIRKSIPAEDMKAAYSESFGSLLSQESKIVVTPILNISLQNSERYFRKLLFHMNQKKNQRNGCLVPT